MSRPLTLHVSALSDTEFASYTSAIHSIVDCPRRPGLDYDKLAVGVREARAWLKGRYSSLPPNTLDSILRLFSPDLGPADVLTAGQFFAALRLVSHVRGGMDVDPGLVFVQAHPDLLTSRSPSPVGERSRVPSSENNPFATNGRADSHPTQVASAPLKPPPPSLPPKPTNPFRRASQDVVPQSAPPGTSIFPKKARTVPLQDAKLPPLPPRKPPVLPPPRHASVSGQPNRRDAPPPVPSIPQSSRSAPSGHMNSLIIQQSLQATRIAQSLKKANEALEQERVMEVLKSSAAARARSKSPTKDASAKDACSSASSTTSSSNARVRTSSHARVPSLPPRRNLSPPGSTVGGSVRSFEQVATASLSPFKRPHVPVSTNGPPSVPPEPPHRRFTSPSQSPSRTPPRTIPDLPPDPPPTHPDRKPLALSVDGDRAAAPANGASPRVGRSRSLHHPSPPPVPPPPRRKRPESAQLTPTASPFDSPFANPSPSPSAGEPPGSPTPSSLMLSRHLSLSSARERARELSRDKEKDKDKEKEKEREREREEKEKEREQRGREGAFADTPMGSLQKTLAGLQLRAQPALDVARYKAEGALSRRGFVQHGAHGPRWMRGEGEARLMDDVDDGGADDEAGSAGPDVDGDEAESSLDVDRPALDRRRTVEERARRWREGGVDVVVVEREEGGRKMVLERDDLKWPAGEGWRPL